ncbi:uncharacterized protein Bfra_007653 [Botrytis fragariae]|uniref:Uncharacterized protein n=1 Tax=Botrytis fragariae TaxID=1964551 RepID=A0A8H6EG70_9HELO|nr:uncharacterized protein Bfra_007653 [Botrytis fragariae]KAF5871139.1 hypothetical protein Bfra_007653 [Botrytis fragariae]
MLTRKIKEHTENHPTDICKYRLEGEKLNELEPQLVPRKSKLSVEELKVKLGKALTDIVDRNVSIFEKKTDELLETIEKLQADAIAQEQAFRQAKLDTETKHRKELGQLAANLEAATTKAEQASADLQKIKQGSTKALAKLNTKLAKNTAALTAKEQELSIATEALATQVSEFENTSKALSEIQQSHSNCSKTIKTLEIDLRDARAINNASRTSTHAEADRMKKGIAKATADLEARLNKSEYNNQGLERKCRMFEDRYSEQVIASAKKEEQLIRSVVEERRSHDRVLELQRDLEKEENRFFELELAFQNLCHKFGVDRE